MRWAAEAREALRRRGYDVVEEAGVSSYQGWGAFLGRCGNFWAVLSWSYGSCGVCDKYERMYDYKNEGGHAVIEALTECIEDGLDEDGARTLFDQRKGW